MIFLFMGSMDGPGAANPPSMAAAALPWPLASSREKAEALPEGSSREEPVPLRPLAVSSREEFRCFGAAELLAAVDDFDVVLGTFDGWDSFFTDSVAG